MRNLRLRERALSLKRDVYAIYLAFKDPRVPLYVKAFLAFIVGYALSPIDLIPDFIPVLGYLDDFILIPLWIALVIKMIPKEVLDDCRRRAEEDLGSKKPKVVAAAVVIVLLWLAIAFGVIQAIVRPKGLWRSLGKWLSLAGPTRILR